MGELATPVQFSFAEVEKMAKAIAESQLFGLQNPQQAIGLMLLCQAEGLHPVIAARDYHIIQGKPALKADAMLARFQNAGGRVEWKDYTETKVTGIFSHPSGGAVPICWTLEMAKGAGLTGNKTWQQYPRQMLRARVISEGIRTVYPAVLVGVYTPEEVGDFEPTKPTQTIPEPERDEYPTRPNTPRADNPAGDWFQRLEAPTEPEALELPAVEMITAKQVSALSIAIKEAGFDTSDVGKHQGRDFVAFVLKIPALQSIKDLTKEQAQVVLDAFGSGENGSYRADKEKLEAAVNDWAGSKIPSESELEAMVETTNS